MQIKNASFSICLKEQSRVTARSSFRVTLLGLRVGVLLGLWSCCSQGKLQGKLGSNFHLPFILGEIIIFFYEMPVIRTM